MPTIDELRRDIMATLRKGGCNRNPEYHADEIMKMLDRKYMSLEAMEDKAKTCPRCDGSGNYDDWDSTDDRLCPACGGSGKVKGGNSK